jgi:hypothetical protein
MLNTPAIAWDPNTWLNLDGDALLSSKAAPSYTMVLLMSGEFVVCVFCPPCDAFWLVLGEGQKVIV